MSLSIAMLINDRLLLPCLCRELGDELASLRRVALESCPAGGHGMTSGTPAPDGVLELGIGHYEQGEPLLTRRPVRECAESVTSESPAFETLFCAAHSNCSLAHAVPRPPRGFHPSEVQPFRFRDWLWAMSGCLVERPGFDRQTLAIPPYIRGNIHTWQPAEVAFHLFLAFLHRTTTLETLHWDRGGTRRALAAAASLVDSHYGSGSSEEQPNYSILTTNGEVILGVGIRRPLFLRRVEGIESCRQCDEGVRSRAPSRRAVRHDHLRAVVVADARPSGNSEGAARWERIEPGRLIEIDGGLGVEVGDLAASPAVRSI